MLVDLYYQKSSNKVEVSLAFIEEFKKLYFIHLVWGIYYIGRTTFKVVFSAILRNLEYFSPWYR